MNREQILKRANKWKENMNDNGLKATHNEIQAFVTGYDFACGDLSNTEVLPNKNCSTCDRYIGTIKAKNCGNCGRSSFDGCPLKVAVRKTNPRMTCSNWVSRSVERVEK